MNNAPFGSAAGRRTIVPLRRHRPTELPDGGMAGAIRAAGRLEELARLVGEALAEGDPIAVRRAVGLALDALEAIEAGLASEFPPRDPGQPAEPAPRRREIARLEVGTSRGEANGVVGEGRSR